MKKNKYVFKIITFLFLPLLIISCVSTSTTDVVPAWFLDTESAFPASQYIAKMADGTSDVQAKNNSMAELASYFSINVNRVMESNEKGAKVNEEASTIIRSYNSTVITTTDLNLFALETTACYYNKANKKWYCVAYISKEKAWSIYEPTILEKEQKFLSLYNYAVEETDPIKKIMLFNYSKNDGQEFVNTLYKACILDAERTNKRFGSTRDLVYGIDRKVAEQKKKCRIYLDIKNDKSNIITKEIQEILNSKKLSVITNKTGDFYQMKVTIDFNLTTDDDLYGAKPSILIEFFSGEENLFSYSESETNYSLSYDKNKCEQDSLLNLAEKINKNLGKYMDKLFEN